MPRFIPIDSRNHQGHGWQRYTDYNFVAGEGTAPLVINEMPVSLAAFPIAFRKRSENNGYEPVAVMSLQPGLNLFVHSDGSWAGSYIPAVFRSYPFRLLAQKGSEKMALCIDADSGLYRENPGPRDSLFFDENGDLSPLLSKVVEFLKMIESQRRITKQAVDALAEQNLIVPWEINAKDSDGRVLPIKGLYKMDESALRGLPAQEFEKLRQSEALIVAYAHLFSQHRLPVLFKLYESRGKQLKEKNNDIDIDKLFGQDDILRFDLDS